MNKDTTEKKERLVCTQCNWETERGYKPKPGKGRRAKTILCQQCGSKMLRKLCLQNFQLKD